MGTGILDSEGAWHLRIVYPKTPDVKHQNSWAGSDPGAYTYSA